MIRFSSNDGQCHIELSGPLTIYGAAEDHASLCQYLDGDGGGRQPIVVDVGAVTAVDSAGIQLLLQLRREGALRGLSVQWRGDSAPLRQIVDLYRLAEAFPDLLLSAA